MTIQTHRVASRGRDSVLKACAIVLEEPRRLSVRELPLTAPGPGDLVVDVEWSGISTGTERLLWSGTMPPFPGLGYPLVPGYESVGRVIAVGSECTVPVGSRVFVSGASCYGKVRGLFGGAASRLVVPQAKAMIIEESLGEQGILMALAATAVHAIDSSDHSRLPDLVVGHGVLGRLLARVAIAKGADAPTVWEVEENRFDGATGYSVLHPDNDSRTDYSSVYDVSGAASIVDSIMPHLARRGEVVLAGFYSGAVSFVFPPAFMREARLRIAAEWQPQDLLEANRLVSDGLLSLDGLITHRARVDDAATAYRTAFEQAECLKMIMDWREH
ncbi:MAG: chlorophyll synthesis pathway protein BchC [Pseudomonadota bacterium]